ncbi:hypothetical protein KJB64_11685 [Staphylococcus cohnii]|uniref:hypothetical protein n=1 Tax=Staphylococcus cohnii TaxID=29382 RepID=UPI0018690DC1|nr:hypothetical protein [Staphylococcus cohnii]MCE5034947.1 hypothetical protein [Staphylococcus cohnii]
MKNVESLRVNNKMLEIAKVDDNNYLVFNVYNNRTIKGNIEVINYFKENPYVDKDSPVFDFVEKKKPTNILNFNIFKISIDNKYIRGLSSFANISTNNIIVSLSLIITLLFIIFSSNLFDFSGAKNINYWFLIIYVYITQIIITALHELSHFYFYQKNFKTHKTNFGITLRYFFLVLFFTSVPFMNLMNKENKNNLILAGIKTQITISGVLCVFSVIFGDYSSNIYFKIVFYYNFFILLTNALPFFKLDGYWYISNVLNINNYMSYYFSMIVRKQKFNLIIFLIGTLNIILIVAFIIYSSYEIYKLF